MSTWIPDWAYRYTVYQTNRKSILIQFYDYHGSGYNKLTPEHREAIDFVCGIIKERKTIDECRPSEWDDVQINFMGQNGNNGEHYQKSKYHREIKPGVWVDVYDILRAYGIKCHALAHAIKKLLMPGERGHKDYNQDCEEAIQSIRRSIDEHV